MSPPAECVVVPPPVVIKLLPGNPACVRGAFFRLLACPYIKLGRAERQGPRHVRCVAVAFRDESSAWQCGLCGGAVLRV